MTLNLSPISVNIDLEKEGKQTAFLRVPYSRNNSAWGAVLVPIVSIKNGPGARILFVGGNHGGEYEGTVALLKLARRLRPEDIQGQVIILPALNLPAVLAGERLSPIDHLDMNRSFPGKWNGTATQLIAHYVSEGILPLCDAVIDLHAGGYSLDLIPYNSMHFLDDIDLRNRTMAALRAFNAPISLVMREFTGEGLLDYAVEGMGKIFLCAEIGGAGRLMPEMLRITETGILNILKHFKVIEGELPEATTRLMEIPEAEFYCYANSSGIYEAFYTIGQPVSAGQQLGQIHYAGDPLQEPETIFSKRDGILVGTRGPGFVDRGDCVAVIAKDC